MIEYEQYRVTYTARLYKPTDHHQRGESTPYGKIGDAQVTAVNLRANGFKNVRIERRTVKTYPWEVVEEK